MRNNAFFIFCDLKLILALNRKKLLQQSKIWEVTTTTTTGIENKKKLNSIKFDFKSRYVVILLYCFLIL